MENKNCCGIYDFDGVLLPGENLADKYVEEVCKEASDAYGRILFNKQNELIRIRQRMEQERDVYGPDMNEIEEELSEIDRKLKIHFILKDQVLEETEERFRNKIPYKKIYTKENIYQGVLELMWRIYESKIYTQFIVNTHVNAATEIVAKRDLLTDDFPAIKFVPVKYHIIPYRDPYGFVNKNREPSDKVGSLLKMSPYIDVKTSTFIDNTARIIKRGKELGLRCYFVDKNNDSYILANPTLDPIPSQVILQAANDTIDIVHGGKIKKLSL